MKKLMIVPVLAAICAFLTYCLSGPSVRIEVHSRCSEARRQIEENRAMIDKVNRTLDCLDEAFRRDFESRYPTEESRAQRMKEIEEWIKRIRLIKEGK